MSKLIINGGKRLEGEIEVKGAKNLAIKLLPATLLTEERCVLRNMPAISDVKLMAEILKSLGAQVSQPDSNTYEVQCQRINYQDISAEVVKKMRASFLFIAPLLARFGDVHFPHPGGDAIGRRPIDMALDSLRQMGAEVEELPGFIHLKAKQLQGTDFTFKWVTHTGTENLIMAAVMAKGKSILRNCALEPEVVALADFLNLQGAKIKGAGTPTIEIEGVDRLKGADYSVIPDRLETGTFAIMGALTKGQIKITKCNPKHLEVFWKYLDLAGVKYELGPDWVKIYPVAEFRPTELRTHEYPGFVTDLQAPFTLLMTQAPGLSLIHETIFDGRLFFTDILNNMGARIIMCDPHRVVVNGPTKLYGQKISSPDLRAGITLLIASLIAEGTTVIDNIIHIDRGYENIAERLSRLGAEIVRVD